MNEIFLPPASSVPFSGRKIATALASLINRRFPLTPQARTNGSKMRKLIGDTLTKRYSLPAAALEEYTIVPERKKGVPRLLQFCLDSYIITTESSYNLQVWNRIPNSTAVLVQYHNGQSIEARDIRYVLVKVNEQQLITTILIMTPQYIEERFGKFGVPTIKHQLMIRPDKRKQILALQPPILSGEDTENLAKMTTNKSFEIKDGIKHEPSPGKLYSLPYIRDTVASRLIGLEVDNEQTKNKGQTLERRVANLLGYKIPESELLEGGYPDIRNQLLEVKLQDSPTIDLGRYTPQNPESGFCKMAVTTPDVRYLIALSDGTRINGVALLSGAELHNHFSYVRSASFKCQRSIPIDFINEYSGRSVYLG